MASWWCSFSEFWPALRHRASKCVSTFLATGGIRYLAPLLVALCGSPVIVCQDDSTPTNSRNKTPLPEYVEEFFLSDAVRNQDKGELQFMLGVESRQDIGTSTAVKMEYGVTNRLQLSFELPYGRTEEEILEHSRTWSTSSLGVQYQIIRSESPFAFSAGMMFSVPVKSGGEVEFQPTILAARTFRRAQIHASFLADIEQWNPSFEYNLASVYPIQRRWFPTLEFNGRRLHGKGTFYLTPGLYRRLANRLEFGVGVPLCLGGNAGAVGVVGKISWEIGGEHESD